MQNEYQCCAICFPSVWLLEALAQKEFNQLSCFATPTVQSWLQVNHGRSLSGHIQRRLCTARPKQHEPGTGEEVRLPSSQPVHNPTASQPTSALDGKLISADSQPSWSHLEPQYSPRTCPWSQNYSFARDVGKWECPAQLQLGHSKCPKSKMMGKVEPGQTTARPSKPLRSFCFCAGKLLLLLLILHSALKQLHTLAPRQT